MVKSTSFKSDKGNIQVYFKEHKNDLHKPVVLSSSKRETLPLLLEMCDINKTFEMLCEMEDIKGIDYIYNYDLLKNIVTGACYLSMKTPEKTNLPEN